MTARYRCPWCGSFSSKKAGDVRLHVLGRHRRVLTDTLLSIESYGITEEENAP